MQEEHLINLKVKLDHDKIPEQLYWQESKQDEWKKIKAMLLSLWDAQESTAMRLDLWVKDMPVDSMGDFFFQTLFSMGDTYSRAVPDSELGNEIRQFAKEFFKKFIAERKQKN